MIINIALWARPRAVRRLRERRTASYWNPFINGLFQFLGQTLDGLPAWPLFETLVGRAARIGAHLLRRRGPRPAHDVEADAATGEAIIG